MTKGSTLFSEAHLNLINHVCAYWFSQSHKRLVSNQKLYDGVISNILNIVFYFSLFTECFNCVENLLNVVCHLSKWDVKYYINWGRLRERICKFSSRDVPAFHFFSSETNPDNIKVTLFDIYTLPAQRQPPLPPWPWSRRRSTGWGT